MAESSAFVPLGHFGFPTANDMDGFGAMGPAAWPDVQRIANALIAAIEGAADLVANEDPF